MTSVQVWQLLLAFGVPTCLVVGWYLGMMGRIKIHKEVEQSITNDVLTWYKDQLQKTTDLLDDFYTRCQHTPDAGDFGTYVTQQLLKRKKESDAKSNISNTTQDQ